ncbi:MAG: hypothetical protein NVSMB38_23370 [Ktedonobacteraceae bacterium]
MTDTHFFTGSIEAEKIFMSQRIQPSQEPKPEQEVQTPSSVKKRGWFSRLSPRTRTLLAIAVIAIAVVLAFHGPSEGESDNVSGDPAVIPTVGITNMVDSLIVNKSVEVHGLHLVVAQVMEATKFSDDRKRSGTYTVRVMMHTRNNGSSPVGIQFDSYIRLVLADGQVITPKYISLLPVTLPNSLRAGFVDFPLVSQVPLSSLALRFGNDATMTLSK